MDKHSFLGNAEISSIEALYQKYKNNPDDVEESWRHFFEGFDFSRAHYGESEVTNKEFKVINLIHAYRQRGHLFTKTNPVRQRRKYTPTLNIENFGLDENDLNTTFQSGNIIGLGATTLSAIIQHLDETYRDNVGVEYMYIRHPEVIEWLQKRMESSRNQPNFNTEQKKHIYRHLVQAVGFEKYLHKKFIGQKSFSLEGAEALIPALDSIIENGAEKGIREFIIGMSHRGRLNVLSNILKKPYATIFREFLGKSYEKGISLGDVKYHLGYGNTVKTDNGKEVRLNLAPNPSHLEAVNGVVEGIARAKIDQKYMGDYNRVAPILIHGDAAIAGQGILHEIIQMAQLQGYKTGGTIHLVINNQVGFTTNYLEGRSSTYSTDIAKVTRSPVFHVNGDDVEALVNTINLAMEFRQKWHSDIFIDILSYRKYGHNEGDEPRFTQPKLYDTIAKHPNIRDIYEKQLLEEKIASKEELNTYKKSFEEDLDKNFDTAKQKESLDIKLFLEEDWESFPYPTNQLLNKPIDTSFDKKRLLELADTLTTLPNKLDFYKKATKIVSDRKKMVENNKLDWAMGELLAYATLLDEQFKVRISGQDSVRGTFAHRHAAFLDIDGEKQYVPLKKITKDPTQFEIYNSLLSEYGVMGFEYGYALSSPNTLTIWEAQFGDFSNVAQVIIDQYISSAEEKWGLKNGLTLLLPHGYEGQGPEHSSARMERFLSMAASDNMIITNPTTPASFYHLLRRQMHREFRLPLIVFTPKSLLRHPSCTSTIEELSNGKFQPVIDDPKTDSKNVSRVVFCTGKIYYDLLERKNDLEVNDIALVRLEQIYPFPEKEVEEIIKKYPNALQWLWVQEEPENMGAWGFVRDQFKEIPIQLVARLRSGSPATGLATIHKTEQQEIVNKVFKPCDCELNNKYCGLQCVSGKAREQIKKQKDYIIELRKHNVL
jgi:2-oxoglutarate dehydrogenase E1 component